MRVTGFKAVFGAGAVVLLTAGFMESRAQETRSESPIETPKTTDGSPSLPVSDPNCTFFGPDRETFSAPGAALFHAASVTNRVASELPAIALPDAAASVATLPSVPGGSRTGTTLNPPENTIDKYIFPALTAAAVAPAPPTTDYEFVRRIYLDLTGRIPTPDQVTSFVNNTSPTKRAALVNTLIGSPEWVDKWTMFFGD